MHIAQAQHLKPLQDTKPFTVRQAKLLKFLTKSFGLIILCVSASTLLCSVPASGYTHITTLSPSKEQPRIVKLLNYFITEQELPIQLKLLKLQGLCLDI